MPDTPWLSIKLHSADYTNVFIRKQYIQNSMHYKKLAKWSDDPVMVFKKTHFKHFMILQLVHQESRFHHYTWPLLEGPSSMRHLVKKGHAAADFTVIWISDEQLYWPRKKEQIQLLFLGIKTTAVLIFSLVSKDALKCYTLLLCIYS